MELVVSAENSSKRRFEQDFPTEQPWFHNSRLVCADYTFASVTTETTLYRYGIHSTGIVKICTEQFSMLHLSQTELSRRGEQMIMVNEESNGRPYVMALLWMDRERRYFVRISGTSLPSRPITRSKWRSVGNDTELVTMEVLIPEVSKSYYEACSHIDRHNRCRREDLNLEKKFEVQYWSMRLNTSL